MPEDDDSGQGDANFKPDPPQKVTPYQIVLLFAYHVLLAILLVYAIYNVWPTQPSPDRTGDARTAAMVQETERKKAEAGAQTSNQSNQNTGSSTPTVTNANTTGVASSVTATNANTAPTASNINAAVSAGNVNAAETPGSGSSNTSSAGCDDCPPPFWLFGTKFHPTLEARLLLLVLLAGALGSYIHVSSSLVSYLGNRTLISSWVWWYLLRPFIGMTLALLFYFVFRGGFITAGLQGGEAAARFINPFGVAAMAGLVGMFSKVAADKLNEVFLTLFTPKAGEGDAKRSDKLVASIAPVISAVTPNVGPATGGIPVTITGMNFLERAGVNFGGTAATAVLLKDSTTLTATIPAQQAGTVDVEVINPNKLNSILKNGFTYVGGDGGEDGSGEGGGPSGPSDEVPVPGEGGDEELIDGCAVEFKTDTADDELPITEGGVK